MKENKDYYRNQEENLIDLNQILNLFFRNKNIILKSTILFLLLSIFYSLNLRRIWQGEFQIVLNKKGSEIETTSILENFALPSFLGANNPDSLKTEVEILQSPSVLMPIFEYSKLTDKKNFKNLSFIDWKKNKLKIELVKGTTILNIAYRDPNKEIIIPVLNKISKTYQDYSGKNKSRQIKLTKDYLKEQIKIFNKKASQTLKKAQEFAIDQDLTILDIKARNIGRSSINLPSFKGVDDFQSSFTSNSNSLITNVDIETARVEAANAIKRINLQIEKIEVLPDNDEKLEFISLTLPESFAKGLPQELQSLDILLLELKSKYKNNDISIVRVKNKRKILVEILKEKAINFLKAEKLKAESNMEAATRPKGIIIKYKELIRDAGRNEDTLINLEDQLISIELQEAKLEDPWELITNPTLESSPVAPSRKNMAFFGLIGGFIFGAIYSFIKENRSGLIFNESKVEEILGSKIIQRIKKDELINLNEDDLLINQFPDCDNQILFILNGLSNDEIKKVKELISSKDKKILFDNKVDKNNCQKKIIFIGAMNNIKYKEILKITERNKILNTNFDGILLLID